jgi:hypothetical protein
MGRGADAADPFHQEDGLFVILGLRNLLDTAVIEAQFDVEMNNPFALDMELEELRLLLQRVIRPDGYDGALSHGSRDLRSTEP